ncbi:hypothetical protein RHOSPDRAFT_25421 [Rhodotorula sp. JG-1b]|nr:hypothetical protein RHOSPDRAFT_25421 [Rhodotorula sp. JG-1b]
MATSRPSTPSNLVQVHTYRHLAPAYAVAPSQGSGVPPAVSSSSSSTLNNHNGAAVRPFTPLEVRQLVLEYLAHEGYVDSAIAFASEMVTDDTDADADASAASGEEEEDPSPGRTGSNALAAAEEGKFTTDGDAMQEDVEATTDDDTTSRRSGAAAAEMHSGGADSPVIKGNGKNVAFLDDGEEQVASTNGAVKTSALSEEEVQDLRLRKTIRDAIVTGRIGQAVDLLTAHYPNVLAPPPPPAVPASTTAATAASVSSKSAFARPLAASKSSTASSCTPQTFFVAPSPNPAPPPPLHRASPIPHLRPSSSSLSSPASTVTGAQFGSWASSLAPEIVSLNLQTQTFIELMRTAHATPAISTPSTPTSSVHGGLASGGGGGDAHSSDAEMSASTSSLGGSASILNVAIAQSQALREKVLQLPVGKDREGWERECIDVCGLLAYKDLATCPVRGYLSQSRRDILAEMVNSAILQHTGRTPLSLLSLAVRQATAMWDTLREMWHPFPPPEAITTGRDRDSNNGKNKPPRTFPIFDLHTFLRDRDGAPTTSPHTPVDDMEA